jgi:hypothetical protein
MTDKVLWQKHGYSLHNTTMHDTSLHDLLQGTNDADTHLIVRLEAYVLFTPFRLRNSYTAVIRVQ